MIFKSKWSNGEETISGSSPVRELEAKMRTLSCGNSVRLGGIDPASWLLLRSRVWRVLREEKVVGMVPVKRLLDNEMTRSLVSRPSWGGMEPVTIPGERMSWVNSVRAEMEGGSDPARLSELAPSERMVTRPREQVTPEKEEQGSSEERFQVEKKGVVGETSVRAFLIEKRALRSKGFTFGCC